MNPGGRYYIKADGTDLNPCLQESKSNHQWFGDADLGDGKVQQVCYTLNSIHTLRVHSAHAAANLNSGYSKYAKVARVHYFVQLHSEHPAQCWRERELRVGLIYFLNR